MKQKMFVILLFASVIAIISCKQKKSSSQPGKEKDFLPVTDFLKGEINHIDSVPYSFTNYITSGEKTDTAYINKTAFHAMLDEFLEVNICAKEYIDYYDETSLIDTSTRLASFTYLANSPKMKLYRIDAYVDPETNKFKKLYFIRNYQKGDTAVSKQLLWQSSGNFILITSNTINDTEIIKQEKVVWDDREE
jgi:hypothetical protein